MKKLLSLIAIAAFGLTTAFAQTPATATTTKVVKREVKATANNAKAATAAKADAALANAKTVATTTTTKVATKAATAKATTNAAGVKLKADGTPDKRYKAVNKVAGPLKKDGTADMRYKANKAAAATKKN